MLWNIFEVMAHIHISGAKPGLVFVHEICRTLSSGCIKSVELSQNLYCKLHTVYDFRICVWLEPKQFMDCQQRTLHSWDRFARHPKESRLGWLRSVDLFANWTSELCRKCTQSIAFAQCPMMPSEIVTNKKIE